MEYGIATLCYFDDPDSVGRGEIFSNGGLIVKRSLTHLSGIRDDKSFLGLLSLSSFFSLFQTLASPSANHLFYQEIDLIISVWSFHRNF